MVLRFLFRLAKVILSFSFAKEEEKCLRSIGLISCFVKICNLNSKTDISLEIRRKSSIEAEVLHGSHVACE